MVVAAAVQSATGFGFSITALPIFTLLFGVRNGIEINLLLSASTNAWVAFQNRGDADGPLVVPLVIGALVGLGPGLLIFHLASVNLLKAIVASTLIVAATLSLFGARIPVQQSVRSSLASGFMSGCLQGSISLGGPPVSLYLASVGLPMQAFRATVAAFFVIPNMVNLVAHFATLSSSGWHGVALGSLLLLAVPIGNRAGRAAFRRMGQGWFRRLVLLVIVGAASTAAVQGIGGLLGAK